MGARDPSYGASRVASKGKKKDARETQCKICKLSIYENQPRIWLRGEVMGLAHSECAERK